MPMVPMVRLSVYANVLFWSWGVFFWQSAFAGTLESNDNAVAEANEVAFTYCDGTGETRISRLFNLQALRVSPNSEVMLGRNFSFSFVAVINSTFACDEYEATFNLAKAGLSHEKADGSDTLCNLLYKDSDLLRFGRNEVVPGKYKIKSRVFVPTFLLPGIYSSDFTVARRGGEQHARGKVCVNFPMYITKGWTDYISAIVAFAVAAAASWQLGKAVTIVQLPLITGYVAVGMIVGPYVCNLVTDYHVYLIGGTINNLALSFIAFAAGEEIYLPALQDLLRSIRMQLFGISVCTVLMTGSAFFIFTALLPGFPRNELNSPCWGSIAFLFAVISIARSPATIVAVLQEMGENADPRSSKLIVGVTVVSDIVVLVGFGLATTLVSSTCPVAGVNGYVSSVDAIDILLIFGQFLVVVLCGGAVGGILYLVLSNPFRRVTLQSMNFIIYRSYIKGAFVVPFGWFIFYCLGNFSEYSLVTFGRRFSVEPLLVCMIGSSLATHRLIEWREQFANILSKFAPYVFLPFFTLTGASLKLDIVFQCLPLAICLGISRLIGIYFGSSCMGRACMREEFYQEPRYKHMWLTMLSQAGVAMGLSLEIKTRFPSWGGHFEVLCLSIIIFNQILGPPLAKVGFSLLNTEDGNECRGLNGKEEGFYSSIVDVQSSVSDFNESSACSSVKMEDGASRLNVEHKQLTKTLLYDNDQHQTESQRKSTVSIDFDSLLEGRSTGSYDPNRDNTVDDSASARVSASPSKSISRSAYLGLQRGRSQVLRKSSIDVDDAIDIPILSPSVAPRVLSRSYTASYIANSPSAENISRRQRADTGSSLAREQSSLVSPALLRQGLLSREPRMHQKRLEKE